MIELGEAGGHFSASWSGGGDDHQGLGGFNVIVLAVALGAYDQGNIVGIAVDHIMAVNADSHVLQLALEQVSRRLSAVLGDDHASHVKSLVGKCLNESEHVHVVGDAQIVAHLVLFNVRRVDGDDDFRLVSQLKQHPQLAVRGKAGKNPGRVVVVKQLSAEFQIELVPNWLIRSRMCSDCIFRYFSLSNPIRISCLRLW